MAERLDPRRTALVLYDLTQTLVEPGRAYEQWVVDGMPTLQRLLHGCRERGVAVFHAVNAKGFAGFEIPRDIAPVPSDTVFRHPESGAFYGTDFEQVLKEQGRDTLLIAGMAVDRGCNTTARDALNRGIRPVVVADACFAYDLQESPVGPVPQREVARVHLAALHRIGALILTTDEVLAAVEPA